MTREQGTGNREQGTGNREQGTGFGQLCFSLLMSVFFRSPTYHPLLSGRVTISGKDGKNAKEYQEKDVSNAIKKIEEIKKTQEEAQNE
jgi:hypothetical protein